MSEFADTHERLGRMHGYVGVTGAPLDQLPQDDAGNRYLHEDDAALARIEAKVDALSTAVLEIAKALIARGAL